MCEHIMSISISMCLPITRDVSRSLSSAARPHMSSVTRFSMLDSQLLVRALCVLPTFANQMLEA